MIPYYLKDLKMYTIKNIDRATNIYAYAPNQSDEPSASARTFLAQRSDCFSYTIYIHTSRMLFICSARRLARAIENDIRNGERKKNETTSFAPQLRSSHLGVYMLRRMSWDTIWCCAEPRSTFADDAERLHSSFASAPTPSPTTILYKHGAHQKPVLAFLFSFVLTARACVNLRTIARVFVLVLLVIERRQHARACSAAANPFSATTATVTRRHIKLFHIARL